jgi:hypothetical protein
MVPCGAVRAVVAVKARRAQRTRLLAVLLLLQCLLILPDARGNEVWLNGTDPITARALGWDAASRDYYQLFQPDAPWSHAASHVSVLLVTPAFLLFTPENILAPAFADLKRRHIALAVETSLLSNEQGCGKGVEAFTEPGNAEDVANRVQKLGGELRYISLGEVLWFGHHFNGTNACHLSIPEVARQVAVGVAAIRRKFPTIQIGSDEVVGPTSPPDWIDQTTQWLQAYRAAAGEPLSFVHVDVDWFGPWQQQLPQLAEYTHAAGIPFGVIYNGFGSDLTGETWTHQAEEHFVAVESDLGLVPDHAILQTWMPQPEHMLPETQPGTMTWLVNRYVAAPSRIVIRRSGTSLAGNLSDGQGRPISGASIKVLTVAQGDADITVVRKLTGTVPAKAARATIALRINDECDCSGTADVTVGRISYRDGRSGQTVERQFSPPSATGATKPHFVAAAGQKIGQNTPTFPVTPSDAFTIEVPLSASHGSVSSGYVAIIFLDQQGVGLSRQTLPFQPSTREIGGVVTDASGNFSIEAWPTLARSGAGFLAEFAGDERYRLSSSFLQ